VGVLDRLTNHDDVEAVLLEHVIPTRDNYRWIEFLSIRTHGQATELPSYIEQLDDVSVLFDSSHVTNDTVLSLVLYANEPDRHVLTTLTEKGCVPFRLRSSTDSLHVRGIVEDWDSLKSIGEALEDERQQFDLISVEESSCLHRPFDDSRMKHVVQDALTTQQFSILKTAFDAGYFDVPKETTSKELAEQLDMSQSTFSEQLRTAQVNLYRLLFEAI